MRSSFNALFISVFLLTSCASPSSTQSVSRHSEIVGTWRWVRADERIVTSPRYIRYYADGTCAWWPSIEAKFSTNGVTYTRYRLEGAVLDTDPDLDSMTFHRYKLVKFRGDTMTVTGEESVQDVYERVVPDLEPGQ